MSQRRRPVVGVVVGALALVLPACGTRLADRAFVASNGAANGGGAAASNGGAGQSSAAAVGNGSGNPSDQTGSNQAVSGAGSGTGSGNAGAGGTGGGTGTGAGGAARSSGSASAAGGATDVGVTASTIKIGNVTSVGGSLGPDAFGVTKVGLSAYVQGINARGGVNGRKLILVSYDDQEKGDLNLALTERLVEQDKVFALIANNALTSARSANYEYTHNVPDLGFPLNNGYWKYPNMYTNHGIGYPRDGKQVGYKNALWNQSGSYRWFKQNLGLTKAAVFFYFIPASAQAGQFLEVGLKREGISVVYDGPPGGENPASPSWDSDVVEMRAKGAQGVWDTIDVTGNQQLCAAMDRQGFTIKAKVSTIEIWGQDVGSSWSSPCRNSVFVDGDSVSYAETSNPDVKLFRDDFARYSQGKQLHQWTLEGWATGQEFVDGVQAMGANITRVGFEHWLDGLRTYTNHGIYDPTSYEHRIYDTANEPNCGTIAQWQDSAGTYVTRAPITYCPLSTFYPSPIQDDGA